MDLPDLVRQALGDEELSAGVSLGDEDAVCFTPTRTLVYRGDGLLSDEAVAEYPHDFERLAVSEGRRKTKFTLTYVDREETISVPGQRTDAVLEHLLQGTLRHAGVLADTESVTGVYRFSELTLIVAQRRVLKHVGGYTWDADFEAYPFADVTGLDFEEGSVATAVVLDVDGRPERIKAPNDQAALLRRSLESALFEHYDVDSLDALNRVIGPEDDGSAEEATDPGGLNLEAGIDPLTGGSPARSEEGDGDEEQSAGAESPGTAASVELADDGTDEATTPDAGSEGEAEGGPDGSRAVEDGTAATGDRTDSQLTEVTDRLDALTETVERQNEALRKQQRVIKQLVQELRQGR